MSDSLWLGYRLSAAAYVGAWADAASHTAAALEPASGTIEGIQRPYFLAVIVQSRCPICLATHMTFSPALSAWEAKV